MINIICEKRAEEK